MSEKERYNQLLDKLNLHREDKFSCFIGLDGFVDEVVHVVDKRQDSNSFSRIETIRQYGERIIEGSGLSMNIEIVTLAKKIGGNGPIFANGLKGFGAEITYIGCVGDGVVDSVFEEFADGCELIGIAEPGRTDAMEFLDGKIIRSKLDSLNKLTWEKMLSVISVEKLKNYFVQSDMLSFNNWTMLPHMSDIWKHMQQEIIPDIVFEKNKKTIFFDLADPRKRHSEDIIEALHIIKNFKMQGFQTILGLNQKEAYQIAELLSGIETEKKELQDIVFCIAEYMQIDCVVVHPVDRAVCYQGNTYYEVMGPYCSKPVLTTGAGDVFNSGFVWGQMQHLSPELCLLMGVMFSGFYVRNGRSADLAELAQFIEQWSTGIAN